MNTRESFKAGVLQKLAESGLTVEESVEVIKQAADRLEKEAFLEQAGNFLRGGASLAAVPLIAAPALGAMGGYGLAKMTDVDDEDVEDIKKRELIDLYRHYAQRFGNKMRGVPQR